MEKQDKKPNIIAIIGAIVLLVLAVVGLSYAFFSAFINGGETDTSVEGTGANLSLVYTDGKNVITSSNIMPGWSATKTFTVTNNGEADTYYKLNISNITNEFVEGGLTFSIASTDGGANIDETPVGTEDRTISSSISIGVGKTHTYTITAKYINLDKDQTPDLGKSFSYTIGIEASQKPTLAETILANNEVMTPLTVPGKEVSAHTKDDISDTFTASVSSTEQAYYITYGTGWTANGTKFNLTGTAVTSDTYANSYSSLVGKYLPESSSSSAGSNTAGTMRTTTNLSCVYYVVSATQERFTCKELCSNKNTTEALLASTEDDYGTSYYFRGAVKNNYVEFANKCWRIVRITGDGSVKLVLHNDNTAGAANPCSSANNSSNAAFARYSGTTYSAFNENYNDNAYIGFKYGTTGASDYATTHANTNKSTILTNLETWYKNNLESYESKLADTIWCNDKSTFTTYTSGKTYGTGLGYGANKTGYGSYNRIYGGNVASYASPSLICPNDNNGGKLSKFTVKDTTNGNGNLTYKIGLLTADEIAFAGSIYKTSNRSTYLQENTGTTWWWSLSPVVFSGGFAGVCNVGSGLLSSIDVRGDGGLRPVISLISSTTILGGTGASEDPYIVK